MSGRRPGLFERLDDACSDLSLDERHTLHSHLLGGLLQEAEDGRSSRTRAGAVEAIARARAFVERDRERQAVR